MPHIQLVCVNYDDSSLYMYTNSSLRGVYMFKGV